MQKYNPNISKEVALPFKSTEMVSLSEGYREESNSVVWLSSTDKIISRGEEKLQVGFMPTGDEPIVNFEEYGNQLALKENGKISDYKGNAGFSNEWYDKMMMGINAQAQGGRKAFLGLVENGMLTGDDFATVKSALLALNTTITPIRNHVLLDNRVVTRIRSDRLDLRFDDFGGPFDAINEDMGVWTIPVGFKGAFTTQTMTQKKYGWHLQWSEDFTMQFYDVDVMGYHLRTLQGQMDTVMNKKVAAIINALSGTVQASWSGFSGGLSTRNAKLDVKNIAKVVDASMRGSPRVIVSNRDVYDSWQTNTTVAPGGVGAMAGVGYTFGNAIVANTEGFDSIIWVIDDLITSDQYTIFDPRGLVFAEGPQRIAAYEDVRTGIRGQIFKRWFGAKQIDAAVFNKGTTIL